MKHALLALSILLLLGISSAVTATLKGGGVEDRLAPLSEKVALHVKLHRIYADLGREKDAERVRGEALLLVEEEWRLLRQLHLELGGSGEVPPEPPPPPAPPLNPEEVKLRRIRGFAEEPNPLGHYQEVVGVLKDPKEQAGLKEAAAQAIIARLAISADPSESLRRARLLISRQLLPVLNSRRLEDRVRVGRIFRAFYPGPWSVIRYDPAEVNFRARYKAWKKWKKFLE